MGACGTRGGGGCSGAGIPAGGESPARGASLQVAGAWACCSGALGPPRPLRPGSGWMGPGAGSVGRGDLGPTFLKKKEISPGALGGEAPPERSVGGSGLRRPRGARGGSGGEVSRLQVGLGHCTAPSAKGGRALAPESGFRRARGGRELGRGACAPEARPSPGGAAGRAAPGGAETPGNSRHRELLSRLP